MNLQLIRFSDGNLRQELNNVVSLISLKLNHFTILRVFDDGSITRKFLLQLVRQRHDDEFTNLLASFYDFLLIIRIGNPLDSSQSFTSVSLLDSNMNQTILKTFIISLVSIKKRV